MSLAILELEKTIQLHETPLWSNMDEIFYPQDYKHDGKTNVKICLIYLVLIKCTHVHYGKKFTKPVQLPNPMKKFSIGKFSGGCK